MIKKIIPATIIIAALAIITIIFSLHQAPPAYAGSDGVPNGGGWFLAPASEVIPEIDRGDFTDYNGDGWLCAKRPPGFCGNRGNYDSNAPSCAAWIWKDNDNE